MRNFIYSMMVSLDGFVERTNGSLDRYERAQED
jgi:hypothetical protein